MSMWNEYLNPFDGIGLLSGHGGVNRSLLKCLIGLSYREQFILAQDNCCLNILEGQEIGKFKAIKLNCTKHLDNSLG